MKKKIFIFISVLIVVGAGIFFSVGEFMRMNRTPIIPAPFPTPTPVSIPTPTRSPNILPKEILEAEREFLKQTPILQKLPANSPYFTIEYISEAYLIVHTKTTDKARDYEKAKEWFVENKINIRTIRVEYN